MSENFDFDVFLSHSSKDKAVVRPLAERLRKDGVKVWFDEWEIKPGDNISAKIEEGLERSRVLVLCMSQNAFDSEWAQLEAGTFCFRDPLNKNRCFIPLRLDDTPIKGSLAQFHYIDWCLANAELEQGYAKLLEVCCPKQTLPSVEQAQARERFWEKIISLGHSARVWSVAWSPDGKRALSGGEDKTVRLWDVESGKCLRVLEGHSDNVDSVAWSSNGKQVISSGVDTTIRLWDVDSGKCMLVMKGHIGPVRSVSWSPDGKRMLSGGDDRTVRVWDVESGKCLRVMEDHSVWVNSVAWSSDGKRALSGGGDKTVRLWDVESGKCLRVMEGHSATVSSVAWSPDGKRALSGGDDKTVRVWDVGTGRCEQVLRGHRGSVNSVAWSPDGNRALSSGDETVWVWDVGTGSCRQVLEGHRGSVNSVAWSPDGKRALSGGYDNTVRVWEVGTGRCERVLEGHRGSVDSVAWSPDGNRALSGGDETVRVWDVGTGRCERVLEGHSGSVKSVAWSPDGKCALSGGYDNTVRVWDVGTGRCELVLDHSASVRSVAWSPDGKRALSGGYDNTVRVWDVGTGRCEPVLRGHSGSVNSVAWSPDGKRALSGGYDNTVRVWEVGTGRCEQVLRGHSGSVNSVVWSPDGKRALSGGYDNTVRVWEVGTGRCERVLEGHRGSVDSVAWSPDGKRALSGGDETVRVWDVGTGRCERVLEGHSGSVNSVAWSPDGKRALSAAVNGVMRIWNLSEVVIEVPSSDIFVPASSLAPEQVQYMNAKVLLVGESGVGKTGLSLRLASDVWQPSDSTVGAWATQWKLPVSSGNGIEREIWLWDFGGQADQRLIHQLYMDETALAVLVFDGQKEDLFETLGQWDRDLTHASRKDFIKILVVGRVDAGGLRVSRSEVEKFAAERKFKSFLETSAKKNQGCEELKQAIFAAINWDELPSRTTEVLFKRLKDEIVRLKDKGRVLMRFNELRETLQLQLSGEFKRFTDDELRAVLTLLAGPGVVWELKFGSWVLLQPERINAYAQAVIRTLQADEHQRGCIMEDRVLKGDLEYAASMERLQDREEERFVLLAMHQTLVERGLCLRQPTDKGNLLVFPSYYRRERPEPIGNPAVLSTYRFFGFLDEIYATLVVRLHHTEAFQKDSLWRRAADFKTLNGKTLGVRLTRRAPGEGEVDVYFDPTIAMEEKITFCKYVHEHLKQHARDVERLRHYVCKCGTPVGNREVAMKRLKDWLQGQSPQPDAGGQFRLRRGEETPSIICVGCEQRVSLWDEMEQCFASPEIQQRVRDMQEESTIVLDNESKERALVGEVISTVALAGQIIEEYSAKHFGLDMEIEFKDDDGIPTAKKIYLQLKSGDAHLRRRQSDSAEIFQIHNPHYTTHWMSQAYPVFLVIRNSEGEVRWMRIDDYLKRESENGKKPVKQIVFTGEWFDVMSVRRWRDKVLGQDRRT